MTACGKSYHCSGSRSSRWQDAEDNKSRWTLLSGNHVHIRICWCSQQQSSYFFFSGFLAYSVLVNRYRLSKGFPETLSVPFLFSPHNQPFGAWQLDSVGWLCRKREVIKYSWMNHPAASASQCRLGLCVSFVTSSDSLPLRVYSMQDLRGLISCSTPAPGWCYRRKTPEITWRRSK